MKKGTSEILNLFYKEVANINLSGNNLKMQRLKISNTLSNFSKDISSIAIDKSLKENWTGKQMHKMYIGEIINVWVK